MARVQKKLSLHFGINRLDKRAYGGWEGILRGCIADAMSMAQMCTNRGFTAAVRTDAQCTWAHFQEVVTKYAETAKRGDTVYISFSGHGGQRNNPLEADGKDETLCFYDGEVSDGLVHQLFAKFKKSVNVVWWSDSCHSATNARNVLWNNQEWISKEKPNGIIDNTYYGVGGTEKIETVCNLIGIAGCRDIQVSYDGEANGAFTGNVLVYFKMGVEYGLTKMVKFYNNGMPMGQNPTLTHYSGSVASRYRRIWR